MATIGLRDLYFSIITEDASGYETYGTPEKLAPAISVNLGLNYSEAPLYADDKVEDHIKEFSYGTISATVSALISEKAARLTGATVDNNGCLIDADDDEAPYVAIGFRSKTSKGKYRYVWLYRVKFSVPAEVFNTKGESIQFNNLTIEGKFYKRNKPDSRGKYPWRNSVTEGESAASATVISSWFTSVPEPAFTASTQSNQQS